MTQRTLRSGSTLFVEAESTDQTVVLNGGPSTIYYGSATVSASSNDGSVTSGNSVTLTASKHVISAGRSALDVSQVGVSGTVPVTGLPFWDGDFLIDGAIVFGDLGETNLYQTPLDNLATDDDFFARFGQAERVAIGARGPGNQAAVTFGGGEDVNLYRSAADTLKTDDSFHVGATFRHLGSSLGFYNATAVAKPTGVAVSAAGIHAALVSLGLIAA